MLRVRIHVALALPALQEAACGLDVSHAADGAGAAGSGSAKTFLDLSEQGNVTVVRLGVHRILDELTIKKFGDELFHVTDRPTCRNLLLDFTGVAGLSSAMLGVLLLLRKKMGQKAGSLKLCHIRIPEIMDIFNATKLGQLFELSTTSNRAWRHLPDCSPR